MSVWLVTCLAALVGTATAQVTPSSFSYVGCYADGPNSNRDLRGLEGVVTLGPHTVDSANPAFVFLMSPIGMTLERCLGICSFGRFRYFGVQSGAFCCCDKKFGAFGLRSNAECTFTCYGNGEQICGNMNRNSIYEISYPPYGPRMLKKSISSMPAMTANSASVSHSSVAARSAIECVAACQRSPDCLASVFAQSKRMCRLLKFAAVPREVADEAEWVWVKI